MLAAVLVVPGQMAMMPPEVTLELLVALVVVQVFRLASRELPAL